MDSSTFIPKGTSGSRKRARRVLMGLGVLVVLGLLLAGAVALKNNWKPTLPTVQLPAPVVRAWNIWKMPAELRAATFVAEDHYGVPTGYRVGVWDFKPAALTHTPAIEKALADPINEKLTTRDAVESPSASRVAFSVLLTGVAPQSPEDWQVNVMDSNGSSRTIGRGLAPFFIDESHVGRFTFNGIVVTDVDALGSSLATSTGKLVIARDFPTFSAWPRVSPDGRFVAYVDEKDDRLVVANARQDFALVTWYPLPVSSFALTNDHLYVLVATDDGTDVISYPLTAGNPQQVYRFPASLHITDLRF
jgi:hypothetical protein